MSHRQMTERSLKLIENVVKNILNLEYRWQSVENVFGQKADVGNQ